MPCPSHPEIPRLQKLGAFAVQGTQRPPEEQKNRWEKRDVDGRRLSTCTPPLREDLAKLVRPDLVAEIHLGQEDTESKHLGQGLREG
jgi:hypothetical protein